MRPAYGLFLFVSILSCRIALGQKENNSVLDKKITLEIQQETITGILEKISAQANVFFSYDASLIEADKKTDLSVTDQTIRVTLDSLFHSKFSYKVLDEQIIITKPETEIQKKEPEVTLEKPTIFIAKGKIINREEKEVVPYTSISVSGTNIGTISNTDGVFELKIPESMKQDTILFSCLGYIQQWQPISEIATDNCTIYLQPTSVQLKEIKITVINAEDIIGKILSKIALNYSHKPEIMTSFYREVLKQDDQYIDVAEAIMEIRKAPYENTFVDDKVKVIKGRKNLNVKPFQYVDFKIQGGPYYITKLDVIKTLDSFLDSEYLNFYKYTLDEIIELDDRGTYVIRFRPIEKIDYPCYQGKLYVDMSSFALVEADFSLSRSGLKFAEQSLIKKKPKDLYVRPINADYKVNYRRVNNKWHLSTAQTSLNFKVKSKKDRVNSTFRSDSELLITDFKPDDGTHFRKDEIFNPNEIFTKVIADYSEGFWGDYNIIKPSDDLQEALRNYYLKNDTLFNINEKDKTIIQNK
ncbi:MAG TPA: carboxypeptidase-like regulatory domain-containing protein [Prolixibacteraceae bacterium]